LRVKQARRPIQQEDNAGQSPHRGRVTRSVE
jgi:hypothetical protein